MLKLKQKLKDHLKKNSAGSAIHLLNLGPVAGDGTSYHPHIAISAPGCWKLTNCQKLRAARNVLMISSAKLMHIYNSGGRRERRSGVKEIRRSGAARNVLTLSSAKLTDAHL